MCALTGLYQDVGHSESICTSIPNTPRQRLWFASDLLRTRMPSRHLNSVFRLAGGSRRLKIYGLRSEDRFGVWTPQHCFDIVIVNSPSAMTIYTSCDGAGGFGA